MTKLHRNDRRQFLRGMTGLLAGGASLSMLPQLELMGRALAATPAAIGNDYKAIVCIFLFGGNDSFNLLIPHAKEEHDIYLKSRGGVYGQNNGGALGIARDQLTQITDSNNKTWGLHPSFAPASQLFQSGELSFLANVGTLIQPLSIDQFNNGSNYPAQLYSHNDQQQQWMRGHSNMGLDVNNRGWGGGIFRELGEDAYVNAFKVPPVISISGMNLYQNGTSALPFVILPQGSQQLNYFSNEADYDSKVRYDTLLDLLRADYNPIMQKEYALRAEEAISINELLKKELSTGSAIAADFSKGGALGAQLKMIARMIKISQRSSIGHKRQIYFASIGGFDSHERQMETHQELFNPIANSLVAFRNALNEIGALNNVLTFSMSDFGRTLNSNGNGTDHGWGGVQFMMGGSNLLQGKKVFGNYPVLQLEGGQSVGRGRMLPTTSVQQYGATIAKWMGVDDAKMKAIFPGIETFNNKNLGFLK